MMAQARSKMGAIGECKMRISLITDLDKESKVVMEDGDTFWKSMLWKGSVTYNRDTKQLHTEIDGKDTAEELKSEYARGGRGMELSELCTFNGGLFSVDDRTGIVFLIENGKPIPWVILADGDGKQAKGFKGEWITIKGGKMYVGGHGREFVSRNGKKIIHRNYMWVKVIDKGCSIVHENWEDKYNAMRDAAGCPYPGYLIHESGQWSNKHKQWFFLPRKVSKECYDQDLDQNRAGNILIRCTEDFKDIKITEIGELMKSRGFSTFKFVPGTDDEVVIALKTEEVGDDQKSYVTAFTVDGKILLPDTEFSTSMKFEGIEFV